MVIYSISELAREFNLSRSTLLYYDRIGLLRATHRTSAGYRQYSTEDHGRLERICMFRSAGLSLADVKKMLSDDFTPSVKILEKRMLELGEEILDLRNQQHSIAAMLKNMKSGNCPPVINKKMWVEMLDAAGMDDAAKRMWHAEFENRAPDAHHDFLLSLGIPEEEAKGIRKWSQEVY